MVHQHFRLVEPFTVAENVLLGDIARTADPSSSITRDGRATVREISEIATGSQVDPKARIWQLSVGEQQRVEIVKALYARLASPHPRRADRRPHTAGGRGAVRDAPAMAAEGHTVIVISHKLRR